MKLKYIHMANNNTLSVNNVHQNARGKRATIKVIVGYVYVWRTANNCCWLVWRCYGSPIADEKLLTSQTILLYWVDDYVFFSLLLSSCVIVFWPVILQCDWMGTKCTVQMWKLNVNVRRNNESAEKITTNTSNKQ